MIKREAKWQTIFNQYLREAKIPGFFELKQTTNDIFPFSRIEQIQYDGLQATEKNGLVWKLSDDDPREKPCDCLSVPPLPSYLVIKFPDAYYMIRINTIVEMRDIGAIGISQKSAEQVAYKIIRL